MASQVVDSLVVATEFDATGLDRSVQASLAQLDRFVQRVDALSRDLPEVGLDMSEVRTALADAGGDLEAFLALLGSLSPEQFSETLRFMVADLEVAQEQFGTTSAEGQRLQAVIDTLATIGARLATSTDATVTSLDRQAAAAGAAATEVEASVQQLNEFVKRVDAISRDLPEVGIDASGVEQELGEAEASVEGLVSVLGQLSPNQFVAALGEITRQLTSASAAFAEGSAQGQAYAAAIDSLRETSSQVAATSGDAAAALQRESGAADATASAHAALANELTALVAASGQATPAVAALGQELLRVGDAPTVLTLDTSSVITGAEQASEAIDRIDRPGAFVQTAAQLQRFGVIAAQVAARLQEFTGAVDPTLLDAIQAEFIQLQRLITQLPTVGDLGAAEAARRLDDVLAALARVRQRLEGTAITTLADQVAAMVRATQVELRALGDTPINFAKVTLPVPDTRAFTRALNETFMQTFQWPNVLREAFDPAQYQSVLDALAVQVRSTLERVGADSALAQKFLEAVLADAPDEIDAAFRAALARVGVKELPLRIRTELPTGDLDAALVDDLSSLAAAADQVGVASAAATPKVEGLNNALPPPDGIDRRYTILADAIATVGAAAGRASDVSTRMIDELSKIGRLRITDEVTGPMSQAGRAARNLSNNADDLGEAFGFSTAQSNKLKGAMTALAVQAAGTSGPVGQLAQTVLLFGGTGAVAGVAAAVAVLAGGYRFLSTATREAREEQERLLQALLASANQAMPAMIKTQLALTAAIESEQRARTTLERIRRAQTIVATGFPAAGAASELITTELARRQQQNLENAARAQRQAAADQKRNIREVEQAQAKALTEAITLQQASAVEIRAAQREVRTLLGLEQDATLTLNEQLDIFRTRVALQKALSDEAERFDRVSKGAVEAFNQLYDTQVQLVRLGFGDPSNVTKALAQARRILNDVTSTEEERLAAANRLNAAAAAMIGPLQEQAAATEQTANNIIAAAREAGGLAALESVLGLTADSSGVTAAIEAAEQELAELQAEGARLEVDGDVGPILRRIEEVKVSLARLREQDALVAISGDAGAGPLQRQIAEVDAALRRLRESGAQTTEAFKQLEAQKLGLQEKMQEAQALAGQLGRIAEQPFELEFKTKLDLRDPDKALADALKELDQRSTAQIFTLDVPIEFLPDEAQAAADKAFEELDTNLLRSNRVWRRYSVGAQSAMDGVIGAVREVVQEAGNLDVIGGAASAGISQVLGLVTALNELAKANKALAELESGADAAVANLEKLTAIGGIIGTGIGILGGLAGALFGGGESERDRVLRENTQAIRENTVSRTTGFEGAGALRAVDLINDALATGVGRRLDALGDLNNQAGRDARADFVRQLERMGITFNQLQQIADRFGIDILVSGRLSADALRQLAQEAEAATRAAFAFTQGLFEDELNLERLRSRALGAEQTPQEDFRLGLEAAAAAGATVFEQAFGDIDLGDSDALRKATLELIEAWENNLIDIEDLGDLTREQWLEIIGSALDAADAIDALTESANELRIVPRGFRSAVLAFEAMDPAGSMPQPRELGDALTDRIGQMPLDRATAALTTSTETLATGFDALTVAVQGSLVALTERSGAPPDMTAQVQRPGDGAQLPGLIAEGSRQQAKLADAINQLIALLGRAKIGTNINGDIIIQAGGSPGASSQEAVLDIRRAFEDLAMADRGNTRDWGRT